MSEDITPSARPAGSGFPAPIRRQTPDRAVSGVRFPVVDNLAMIAEDDDFLSAIATGGFGELFQSRREVRSSATGQTRPLASAPPLPVGPIAHRPAGLGPLLAAWRSEIVDPPLPLLPVLPPRVMNAPADRSRSRSLRPLLSVAAAICALLLASTAVGAHSAQPGEPLWALTQVLWSGHAQSVEAEFSASNNIMLARRALTDGDPQQASIALKAAYAEMADVSPDDGLTQLQHDWAEVNTRVAGAVAAQASSRSSGGRPPTGISIPGDVPVVGAIPVTTTTSSPTADSGTSPAPTVTSGSAAPPAATLPPLTSGPGPNTGSAPSISSSSSAGNPPAAGGQPVAPAPVVPGRPGSAAPVTTSAGSVPTSPNPAGPGSSVGSTVVPPPPAPTTDPASPAPTSDPVVPPSTSSPSGTTTDPTTASVPPSTSDPASTDPLTSATAPGTTAGTDTSTTSEIPTAGTSTSVTDSTTDPATMGTDTTTTQTAAAGTTGESTPWYSTDGGTTAGSPTP